MRWPSPRLTLMIALLVTAGCLAVQVGVRGIAARAIGLPQPPLSTEEALRRALREAVDVVKATKGDEAGLEQQRLRALDTLTEARRRAGNATVDPPPPEPAGLGTAEQKEGIQAHFAKIAREATECVDKHDPAGAEAAYDRLVKLALAAPAPRPRQIQMPPYVSMAVWSGTRLARDLTRDKQVEAASRVLIKAREVALKREYPRPALPVARGLVAAGDLEAARATLDEIERRVEKNPALWVFDDLRTIIAIRWSMGDKDAARALYRKAADLARSRPADANPGRSSALGTLAPVLVSIGDFDEALRLTFSDEIEPGARHGVFGSVVTAIGRCAGLVDGGGFPSLASTDLIWDDAPIDRPTAREWLRRASAAAKDLPVASRADGLLAVLRLQARLGDLTGARQTYRPFAELGVGDPERDAKVNARLESDRAVREAGGVPYGRPARDAELAQETWNATKARESRAAALAEVARAAWKAGDREAAEAEFAAALSAAETLPGERPSEHLRLPGPTYPRDTAIRVIVQTRAELGHVDGAVRAAGLVHEPQQRADALVRAAQARQTDGDLAGALRLAEAPGHGFPSLRLMSQYADAQAQGGDQPAAQATLRRALKEAEDYLEHRPFDPTVTPYDTRVIHTHWDAPFTPSELKTHRQASAARAVALLRAKLGDTAGALRAAEAVEVEDLREHVLPHVLHALAESGDAPAAFARAFRIKSPMRRVVTINGLAGRVGRPRNPAEPSLIHP
jgi:tetratricopeptide (TPR) repeat protein